MCAVIYPTSNLSATEQLIIDRSEGIYLYDQQGKRYIARMTGLWCTSLG
jgi:4-aminobutyrate--pyruvate transaminase